MRNRDGALLASGDLARTLSRALASEAGAPGGARIGETIWSMEGRFCRSFVLQARANLSGIACREGSDWRIVALDAGKPAANAENPAIAPPIRRALNAMQVGAALDAAAERAARAQDWRAR
jgi:hypothetical protein